MNYNRIYSVYKNTPSILLYPLYYVPVNLKFGKIFVNEKKRITDYERLSITKKKIYLDKQLKDHLNYCISNVKFYHHLKVKVSCDPWKILSRFPIIDKKTVQDNYSDFISQEEIPHVAVTTGGTLGKHFKVLWDNTTYHREWAHLYHIWKSAIGFSEMDRLAAFRTGTYMNMKKGETTKHDSLHNMQYFSPVNLNDKKIASYIEKIKHNNIKWIFGYPSAISMIADYILKNNFDIKVRGVICASENSTPEQRQKISMAFGVDYYDFYGMTERVLLGSLETKTTTHIMDPIYGITEIDENYGNEILGTGLLNRKMPLIRYRTDDHCNSYEMDESNNYVTSLNNIQGRWEGILFINKLGERTPLAAINFHDDLLTKLHYYQYIQREKGTLVFRYYYLGADKKKMELELTNLLQARIGNCFELTLENKKNPQISKRGKFLFAIQTTK